MMYVHVYVCSYRYSSAVPEKLLIASCISLAASCYQKVCIHCYTYIAAYTIHYTVYTCFPSLVSTATISR